MNFKQEYYLLYIAVSVSVAVILSFLFYRKTVLNSFSKLSLAGLRALSVLAILLLLFISFITLSKKITDKPVNIFLFDNSPSMTLENRIGELNKSEDIINALSNNYSVNKYYVFSGDDIKEIEKNDIPGIVADSMNPGSTNLTAAISKIVNIFSDKKISSVNIFSDGIINSGGSPINIAEQTGSIYNYFLTGDTVQKNDLLVKNIYFNNSVYTESNSSVLAEINSYNYDKTIKVDLYEDDILKQTKEIRVTKEKTVYNQLFTVKSNEEGIKKFKVEIEKEPDEVTYKNNSEEFFIDFLKNKFKILVLSGNPSSDFSYLSGTLKSLSNIEAKFFTQKAAGVYYEGQVPTLDDFNVLLLINFPNSFTDLSILNSLNENIKKINMPLIFISGSNTDYEKLKILSDCLPVADIRKGGNEVSTGIKTVNDLSSDIAGYFSFGNTINNLSDIFIPGINFSLKPESRTILFSSKASKPVLVISENKDRNSAVLLAYDFYKWRLNSSNSMLKNILAEIISGIILNIGNKENNKKINFSTDKQIYSPGELIRISGTVNITDIKGNETVKLQIYNNKFSNDIGINKASNNSFSVNTKIREKGEYFIQGILYQNGIEIGQDVKKILVKESVIEFKNTKPDRNILDNLAGLTGGRRITVQGLSELKDNIKQRNENDLNNREIKNKIFLNSSLFILVLVIILLSAEWFIRKRLNLP